MSSQNLKTIETISLDFYNNNIKTINVKQLDTKSRYVKISCTEHGKFSALNPDTMSSFVRCRKPDGFSVLNKCSILPDGTILLELTQQMLAISGKCTLDVVIFRLSGNQEHTENDLNEIIYNNDYIVTDDENGNVKIVMTDDDIFESIEDIYHSNIPILSTMTFYLNVLPSAIEHAEIESSYEYDALIQGMKNQELIEEYMKELDKTLTGNEAARVEAESARQQAETSRQESENLRNNAEQKRSDAESDRLSSEETRKENEAKRVTAEAERLENEQARVTNEGARVSNEEARKLAEESRLANETIRQKDEKARSDAEKERRTATSTALENCSTATINANEATTNANSAAENAKAATVECITATSSTTEAVKNCNTAAAKANDAAERCQGIVTQTGVVLKNDIANNLTTQVEGMVLDATQGKVLYDLLISLPQIHYGYEKPDSSIGKDGDIYMLIIEEASETVGE